MGSLRCIGLGQEVRQSTCTPMHVMGLTWTTNSACWCEGSDIPGAMPSCCRVVTSAIDAGAGPQPHCSRCKSCCAAAASLVCICMLVHVCACAQTWICTVKALAVAPH